MFIDHNRLDRLPPRAVQVVGERGSGTNYIELLLTRNLALSKSSSYGWKHGFLQQQGLPKDVLFVACFRHPYDWLRSLYAKPWHSSAELQRLSFSDFIRAPWDTYIEPRYKFMPMPGDERDGPYPLLADRHPITGARIENPLMLRTLKAHAHLGLANREVNFVALTYEGFAAEPGKYIARLADVFGLEQTDERYRVRRQLGAKFRPAIADRSTRPKEVSSGDLAFIRSQLDLSLEERLGYRLD